MTVDTPELKDAKTISAIAKRAHGEVFQGKREHLDIVMDLDSAHDDVGLDLDGLLQAPSGDFAHDVSGIAANLDRGTRKLTDCFLPRFHA